MKLARLRGRLSYANVIATVALFFALTGSAMAGAKYLVPTDTIPAASDLTGTYGSPQIADGKVTASKIANGAITSAKFDGSAMAPNADKLDGMDSEAFAQGVIEVFRPEAVALPTGPLGLSPGADVIQHTLGPGRYLVLYRGQVELPANGGGANCAATGGPGGSDVVTVDAYHAGSIPWHSPIVMTTTVEVPPNTTADFKINCVGAPGTSIGVSRLEILRAGVSS